MAWPSLLRLTLIYLRIGNLTFGGGDPTMAALQSELVFSRGWLPPEKYGLIYALARITPGTNLLAFCAGSAWQLLGWGAAVAGVAAVTVPSAAVVVLLTKGYEAWKSNPLAMAAISGTLASALGMMATGAWLLVRPHLSARRWLRAVVSVGGSLVLSLQFGVSPIQVLMLAALIGWFWQAPAEQ